MGKRIAPAVLAAAGLAAMSAIAVLHDVIGEQAGSRPEQAVAAIIYPSVGLLRNPDGTPTRGALGQRISKNWAGYVLTRSQTGVSYQSAAASWIVPKVTFQPYSGQPTGASLEFSGTWVGIGGFCTDSACTQTDSTLIQMGTGQQVSSAAPDVGRYRAWYETLPQRPIQIPSLTIRAGDEITASLACQSCGDADESWTLQMQVYRPGTGATQSWSTVVPYRSSHLSAEWIEEAPKCRTCRSPGALPLADFGTASFQPVVRANGHIPEFSLSDNGLVMIDPWGQSASLSAPTALANLNACWGAWVSPPAALAPCAPPPPPYWQPPT